MIPMKYQSLNDDQVDLHNQETFEDHINNLEQVLET